MFASNLPDAPPVGSFDEALRVWRDIPPLRGKQEDDWRPVGRRESRNPVKVRAHRDVHGNDVVVFRHHRLDVVEWTRDRETGEVFVTIRPYESRTTTHLINIVGPIGLTFYSNCTFVEACLPDGSRRAYKVLRDQMFRPLTVRVASQFAVTPLPDADAPDGTVGITHRLINQSETRKLYRQHNLSDFLSFYHAYTAMDDDLDPDGPVIVDMTGAARALSRRYSTVRMDDVVTRLPATYRHEWPALARYIRNTLDDPEAVTHLVGPQAHAHILRAEVKGQPSAVKSLLHTLIRRVYPDRAYELLTVRWAESVERLQRIEQTRHKV
jgi:hypothetical protein